MKVRLYAPGSMLDGRECTVADDLPPYRSLDFPEQTGPGATSYDDPHTVRSFVPSGFIADDGASIWHQKDRPFSPPVAR